MEHIPLKSAYNRSAALVENKLGPVLLYSLVSFWDIFVEQINTEQDKGKTIDQFGTGEKVTGQGSGRKEISILYQYIARIPDSPYLDHQPTERYHKRYWPKPSGQG